MEKENTASLVLGIVGICLGAVSFWAFGWLSIIGFILGLTGVLLPNKSSAGKVTSIISLIISAVFIVLWIIALANLKH